MGRVIVVEFVTLDGVVEDPDGSWGAPGGGWALRHGPEAVIGDKFDLGPLLGRGALLFGRSTWELFSRRWPGRDGGFADAMNGAAKLVASRTLTDVGAWSGSSLVDGDVLDALPPLAAERDVVVVGSTSLVHALAARDLVDEYRLLVFPTVLGTGERLFPDGAPGAELALTSVRRRGPAVLMVHERVRG
ncbi:dihydrofolate reductase family protein [Pseudonocardia humida]|uniref:Dihydrofolate reductase family protein n=1 Tax=Pseudonocardia humida TaxID=2800819 RepID=A0ABT1A0R7_9PSEU|nr:dihydrofolate reductase family protein [Pseudonocardia humida]MCO1656597.1 dihydrofolate reductase family protein [Pseudonocardia humida]